MRARCCVLLLGLLLLAGPAAAATLGDAQIGFTADRTLVIDGHKYLGKIWTMPGKERHEQAIKAFRADLPVARRQPARRDRTAAAEDDRRSSRYRRNCACSAIPR